MKENATVEIENPNGSILEARMLDPALDHPRVTRCLALTIGRHTYKFLDVGPLNAWQEKFVKGLENDLSNTNILLRQIQDKALELEARNMELENEIDTLKRIRLFSFGGFSFKWGRKQ